MFGLKKKELYLVGFVHMDTQLKERMLRAVDLIKPDVVSFELSGEEKKYSEREIERALRDVQALQDGSQSIIDYGIIEVFVEYLKGHAGEIDVYDQLKEKGVSVHKIHKSMGFDFSYINPGFFEEKSKIQNYKNLFYEIFVRMYKSDDIEDQYKWSVVGYLTKALFGEGPTHYVESYHYKDDTTRALALIENTLKENKYMAKGIKRLLKKNCKERMIHFSGKGHFGDYRGSLDSILRKRVTEYKKLCEF